MHFCVRNKGVASPFAHADNFATDRDFHSLHNRRLFRTSKHILQESELFGLHLDLHPGSSCYILFHRIRSLPSRIRRVMRRVLIRFGLSREPESKLERFQRSIAKIFSTNSRGSREQESSGFISDEEDLNSEYDIPDYSDTELKIRLNPPHQGTLTAETDGPVEIEMIVFK